MPPSHYQREREFWDSKGANAYVSLSPFDQQRILSWIAAGPEVRSVVEASLKRTQKSWSARTGDPDAAWALIAQCVGALVLARAVESERTRKDILAASRRFLDKALPAGATNTNTTNTTIP